MDDSINGIWDRVRRRHLFPELPTPRYVQGETRVGLDIKDKRISISQGFVKQMSSKLNEEKVIEGLLDHAVSHYLYCPWNLATHLKLYAEAKRVLKDKEMARKATDYFMDVVADTFCVSQKETPLPSLYRHLDKGFFDQVILALLQRIWGMDLAAKEHSDISRKLSRLPYLDCTSWPKSIRAFCGTLQPLLEMEKANSAGSFPPNPMGRHTLGQYSTEEIEEGLKELAIDADSPGEFKDIIHDFENEIRDAASLNQLAIGIGLGRSLDANLLYYMKLAENYVLPIRRKPMEKNGALYPHHHVPWESSHPYQDVDPWTSLGKILPGITQTWRRHEGEVYGREEGIPDCILIIDSSGSMTNPKQELSYAVLGAACAGDAYLRNNAEVAVYNFSDADAGGRKILTYCQSRKDMYRTICHYFGGGTRLHVENIESLQKDSRPDIFLITDMQITDLQMLIQYFNDCKSRVTAVHLGENLHVEKFRRSMNFNKNVAIYAVEHKNDIPQIMLGKIQEFFYP